MAGLVNPIGTPWALLGVGLDAGDERCGQESLTMSAWWSSTMVSSGSILLARDAERSPATYTIRASGAMACAASTSRCSSP